MTCVSFFSGCGGFEVAFHKAGFETLLQVEIEENCQKLLRHKFGCTLVADIRAIVAVQRRIRRGKKVENYEKWKEILRLLSVATVFYGGWPCQDFSVAGRRDGLAGERSGLWFVLRRIIAVFRPSVFVGENVPGMLSSNKGRDALTVFAGLSKCGYRWSYRVLDAQFFNLAQRRERVFIIASIGAVRPEQVLFEPESLCWNPAPSRKKGERTAPTVEGRVGRSGCSNFATSGGVVDVVPPIAGVSNGGGANGPGRTVDDAEALILAFDDYSKEPVDVAPTQKSPKHGLHYDGESEAFILHGSDGTKSTASPTEVATALTSHRPTMQNSSMTVALAFRSTGHGVWSESEQAQSPRVSPAHESTVVAFDPTQITSKANRSDPKLGDPLHTLAKDMHAPCVAFSSKDSGNDCRNDISPTLRTQNFKESHMNGGGQVAVAFRSAGRDGFDPSEIAPPIASTDGGGAGVPSIAFHGSQDPDVSGDVTHPVGRNQGLETCVSTGMQVRRMTPTECLRVQGFSDDWFDGLNFSDSVKYRLIGNSVAVSVVAWIAKRLAIEIARTRPPG